jgi:Spherulation-specific family 4
VSAASAPPARSSTGSGAGSRLRAVRLLTLEVVRAPRRALIACALVGACGEPVGSAVQKPAPVATATPEQPGCLVPLYAYPTEAAFAELIAHKERFPDVPVLAVINPGTTGAGPRRDPVFAEAIRELVHAGIEVAGYVSLGYGARARAECEREVDHYRAWYPEVESVFFDELSSGDAEHGLHVELTGYARDQGMRRALGNPGTSPNTRSAELFDVLVVYENAGLPELAGLPVLSADDAGSQRALLAYDVAELDEAYVRAAAREVAYLYVTDDRLDNPYDSLPAYFPALLAALAPRKERAAR